MKTPIYAHLVNGWNLYDVDDRYLLSIPEVPDDQQIAEEIVRAVNATAWRSPDEPPARTWVLVTISPRNLQYPPRVIEAMYDADRGHWRSRASLGKIDEWLEVTGWMPLPRAKEER